MGWLILAVGLLAEGGILGDDRLAGVWPRQDKTVLGHHLCGLFVATGLCAVGEGAGLICLGWLVGGAKGRGTRGRPPQTACLPGLVLVLGVARAAVALLSTPARQAAGWVWLTGGGQLPTVGDQWAVLLPGFLLTLAVAESAARAAHAEAEILDEEQARPARETELLRHPATRALWRQGLAACAEEWWVVWWAHAPVLVLLTLVAAAAHHVLATVDTTNAGLPEQFLEIFARALAGLFGVRFGHLKLAVAGAVAFCLFGAGGMVLLFEAAALPLDLAEVAQHGREDRDLVLAAVAGWAGGKSVLPLEGASEFALDLYADSGGVGMDGSALDVEDAALALAHVFRVGRHRWATGAKKLQRERAASRRAAASAGMAEVGAATASGLRFLWSLVPGALAVLQHLLGFAGLALSVARRVLRGLREAAGAALRALRDLGSATAASAPLGAAGFTGGGEIRRFPGLRLYPFWGCPVPSSGVFQEPPFDEDTNWLISPGDWLI